MNQTNRDYFLHLHVLLRQKEDDERTGDGKMLIFANAIMFA